MKANVLIVLFLITGFSLCGQVSPTTSKSMTFEEALGLSLQNNHLIRQSNNKSLQMEQEVKAAKGLHLPRLSLSASYVYMSDNMELDLTPVRDAITPLYNTLGHYGKFGGVPNPDPKTNGAMPFLPDDISTAVIRGKMLEGLQTVNNGDWIQTIQEKKFGMVNAGFVMPLYTGGKINAANSAAKIKFEASEIETIQKSHELTSELVERYFGLILANQAVKVRQEVKAGMQKHFEDAEKLAQQGMIARVEVLNAKVYYADADRELKKSDRQVEIMNEAVLNTVAEVENSRINPLSELFYIEKIESLDYYKQNAIEKSPLLGQVSKKKELAQQGIKVEKSAYLPTIAATGTYDIVNKDLSPYLPDYMVGVGLQWSLFDGMARSRKVKAAQFQAMQADDFYAKAESDINSAITKYYQELHMYLEQINELDAAMDFTAEYSRAREKAFSEGMATATQVSDANLAVAKAKIERLQAIYAWDVALSKLLYYSGMSDKFVSYMSNPDVKQGRY
ncbi:MAG TPA: TolC family protein [Prolixibacteraceae bacterium]|jgi:outer membrane protein TolC